MNILITGGPSSFVNRLIAGFQKEGHRVSVLTGSYHTPKAYEKVFEQYNFPYSSNYLPDIFSSASPDLVIFSGILDGGTQRNDIRKFSSVYLTDVMSVLNAFSLYGKGRLVVLSSEEVYQYRPFTLSSEEESPDAKGILGLALTEAESLCEKYRANFGLDILICRIGGLCRLPSGASEISDVLSALCLARLRDGKVQVTENREVMLTSEADAAYFLMRAAMSDACRFPVYHIASGTVTNLPELSGLVEEAFRREEGSRKKASSGGPEAPSKAPEAITAFAERQLLDNRRYRAEFGMNRVRDMDSMVSEAVRYFLDHRELFAAEEPGARRSLKDRYLWLLEAAVPYAENLAVFLLVFFLNGRLQQSAVFSRIDLYLLYVLLFAVLYGQSQGVLSAFLSVFGMLFVQIARRSGADVLMDYSTYSWIAQLFIVGLSVGYLKDRINGQRAEAMDDYEYMTNQVRDIREINGSNRRVKDALEVQLINHNDSVGKIYQITSGLDSRHSVEVLFSATDVLRRIMDNPDIAVYAVHDDSPYARLFTATTPRAGKLGGSFLYEESGALYDAFRERKAFINRNLEKDLPAMAYAVYEEDAIRFIIMVWTLPMEKMTMGQANLLTVTCLLMRDSVFRARNYYEAVRHTLVVGNTPVLQREPYRGLLDTYENAVSRRLTVFALLKIGRYEDLGEIWGKLSTLVRANDYPGLGKDGTLYVLISNTDHSGAEIVAERLKRYGIAASVADPEEV